MIKDSCRNRDLTTDRPPPRKTGYIVRFSQKEFSPIVGFFLYVLRSGLVIFMESQAKINL